MARAGSSNKTSCSEEEEDNCKSSCGTQGRDRAKFGPFHRKRSACRAGVSSVETGPLKKVGDKYQAWFGTLYVEDQVVYAKHRLDDEPRCWGSVSNIHKFSGKELPHLLPGG